MGTRGCVCEPAIVFVAGCAMLTRAMGWFVPKNGAQTLRRYKVIRLHNTNISFHSVRNPGNANLGYSVSMIQFVGLAAQSTRHPTHETRDLPVVPYDGTDLLARRWAGCGLNSRQINHLRHIASETHYRGQCGPNRPGSQIGDRR